ncbi:MAG: hypothetical protein NTZ80_03790 [Patescibacteria group bacterium]|nr:hypothetical protein [Patescibacteria group bacterium]
MVDSGVVEIASSIKVIPSNLPMISRRCFKGLKLETAWSMTLLFMPKLFATVAASAVFC